MTLLITHNAATGGSYEATISRPSDGYFWNDVAGGWQLAPSYANKAITLTEQSGDYIGYYAGSPSTGIGTQEVRVYIHDAGASNLCVATEVFHTNDGEKLLLGNNKVDAIDVIDEHTLFIDGNTSSSIVEVETGFAGTIAVAPDLADSSAVGSVTSVALTGVASFTGNNLRKSPKGDRIFFDVAGLTTTGDYTATVKFITTDSQPVTVTGTITTT